MSGSIEIPKITISPIGGPPGTSVRIISTFHTAGSDVYVYLDAVRQKSLLIKGSAESNGFFHGSLKIPQGISSGTHYIWVKDGSTGLSNVMAFNVT